MGDYTFLIGFCVLAVAAIVAGVLISKSKKKQEAERLRSAKMANKRAAAAEKLREIPWKDQFSIDGGVIDKEHKTLFSLVNKFNESIPKLESPGQMLSALASIKKYTQTHFQREEKLQQISDFSFCEEHKKEHEALVEQLNVFIEKVMQANEDNFIDLAVEIGSFLQKWITGHVIDSDLPMKPYVDRLREDVKVKGEQA